MRLRGKHTVIQLAIEDGGFSCGLASLGFYGLSAARTYTFQDSSGTVAFTAQLPSGTNPVPVGSGGTGSTTAAAARVALGAAEFNSPFIAAGYALQNYVINSETVNQVFGTATLVPGGGPYGMCAHELYRGPSDSVPNGRCPTVNQNVGSTYTLSFWAKAVSGNAAFTIDCDRTIVVNGQSVTTVQFTCSTEWKRFTVTYTVTGSAATFVDFNLSPSSSIRVAGVQVNDGDSAYLHTIGSAVTTGFDGVVINRNLYLPCSTLGIGITTNHASAALECASTTKGFRLPVMTGAQAEAIASPAEGLMVYATNAGTGAITSKGWWGFDGTTWVRLN